MKQSSELQAMLKEILGWNKARLTCFTKMLLALFAVRTVNLRELAVAFCSDALLDSRYKRLKRFFSNFKVDSGVIAIWIFNLFFPEPKKVYIIIDRTNWYWGKQKINIFMLGIAYEGLAIPLYWRLLPKAGNSNFTEQQALLNRFITTFGTSRVVGLLADREFASGELFRWLNDKKVPFYIRIKEGSLIVSGNKKILTAKQFFNELKPKTSKEFLMTVKVFGQKVYLAGSRSERGELMIVATNQLPQNAIPIYLRRWEIEMLFQSLKGRGFRFEETRLTQLDRIEKLILLLVIGFCWAHKVGEWRVIKKPILFNRYIDSRRPQYSYFRYGFDLIREALLNPCRPFIAFRLFVKQIIYPFPASFHRVLS
ncbi:MAG TPA: IS4 family transposase [Nitrosopumilaceae archaeon]|nr:IS4 family transposase [Nitrosopumilaceae archaeon]